MSRFKRRTGRNKQRKLTMEDLYALPVESKLEIIAAINQAISQRDGKSTPPKPLTEICEKSS